MSISDAQRILAEAYADCGCGIPSPFDEVAEHAVTIAEAKGFERGKMFGTPTTPDEGEEAKAREVRPGVNYVIAEAKRCQRLVQGCLECNADDERRWSETIEWLERLA